MRTGRECLVPGKERALEHSLPSGPAAGARPASTLILGLQGKLKEFSSPWYCEKIKFGFYYSRCVFVIASLGN